MSEHYRAVAIGSSLLLLALLASPASGQDVSGTWRSTVYLGGGGGTGGVTLELVQDGAAVRGTYTGSYGTAIPLTGTADGDRVAFSFSTDNIGDIAYEGTVAADSMWGSVTYGTRFDGTFGAYRRPPATIVSTIVGYGVLGLLMLVAVGGIVWSGRR
ncbi:MAG: hypothetical protein PVJ80_14605 [Gemmatimonadota bacterium]|jgi:hypothetical protein